MSNFELPSNLSQPAHRALANAGISTLDDIGRFTEREIRALNGMGPAGLKILKESMARVGVEFSEGNER